MWRCKALVDMKHLDHETMDGAAAPYVRDSSGLPIVRSALRDRWCSGPSQRPSQRCSYAGLRLSALSLSYAMVPSRFACTSCQ